jgi:AraC-like DNA-binding protein
MGLRMVRIFDSADFAPRERRDAYMNAFTTSELPQQVSFPAGVELSASIDLWDLGPGMHLLRSDDVGHRLTRTSRHLRMAAPERIALVSSRRHAVAAVGGSMHHLLPGDLHINDQTLPSDYVGLGVGGGEALIIDYDVLSVPIDLGRRAVLTVAASPLYEFVRQHLANLSAVLESLPDDEQARLLVGSSTMDLARALLSTASGGERLLRAAMHDTESKRIHAYINQHLADRELTPSAIARASHVSLRQLYKVWGSDGTSLSEYIIAARLNRARDDLRRPSMSSFSIADIARRWGFADAAHFSRRFKRAFGMTAREWRHQTERP